MSERPVRRGPARKGSGPGGRLIATLWRLEWDDDRLLCTVYRQSDGLQLRVESAKTVILSEPFSLGPRALARTNALRESLKRRGWRDLVTLALCLLIPAVVSAQTLAEVAADVSAAENSGVRLEVYAAAYRGTGITESLLIGAEVRGLSGNAGRGRRLQMTYSFAGPGPVPRQSFGVPLDEAAIAPDMRRGVRVLRRFQVPPGTHQVTVEIRDSLDGRTASVVHTVDVPAYGGSPEIIAVSQIMVTSSAVDGFTHADADEEYRLQPILAQPPAARRQFSTDEKVEVLAEIYEPPPDFDLGGQMTVWTRIRNADGRIVFDTSDIGASETFSDGRWGYQHWQLVPVRDLAPGRYVLQVGATGSDGNSEAWRSIPITIVPGTRPPQP